MAIGGKIGYFTGDPLRLLEDCQILKPNFSQFSSKTFIQYNLLKLCPVTLKSLILLLLTFDLALELVDLDRLELDSTPSKGNLQIKSLTGVVFDEDPLIFKSVTKE